jgi:8-oxo-dGTP pyrophosphatase MutT (NUDIX family)
MYDRQTNKITEYSLGFMFNHKRNKVALILKLKPQWQARLLNGIGGVWLVGESIKECMVREFKEETGVATNESAWRVFAELRFKDCKVHCFKAFSSQINNVTTNTLERVGVYYIKNIPWVNTVSNLRTLVYLALHEKTRPDERIIVKCATDKPTE